MEKNKITNQDICELAQKEFEAFDFVGLINWLKQYQQSIKSQDIQLKGKKEVFSLADLESQKRLVEYLKKTNLFDYCSIRAEETIDNISDDAQGKEYEIVIDPLDGSSEYVKKGERWGIMIGICDSIGKNIYSWLVTSRGEIFSSEKILKQVLIGKKLPIDVYAYKDEALISKAQAAIAKFLGEAQFTSLPSAIWAARQLITGQISGLLWLPSDTGKGGYPDYDLVFLDAVLKAGFKIKTARSADVVQMLAIAPTAAELELLWNAGINALGERFDKNWEVQTNDITISI